MFKRITLVGAAVLLVLVVASTAYARPFSKSYAWARIVDASGHTVGAAMLFQKEADELRVFAWARDLAPGKHGIHLHAVGSCDDAAFLSAGPHFNPEVKEHGLLNPNGAHGGDLPNMEARESGLGLLHASTDRATLDGGPKSLFDADGSAVVIHAGEDDQVTNPTGNSGARVACGVIQEAR